MQTRKTISLIATVLVVGTAAAASASPANSGPDPAGPPFSTQVLVTNTADQPIPVTFGGSTPVTDSIAGNASGGSPLTLVVPAGVVATDFVGSGLRESCNFFLTMGGVQLIFDRGDLSEGRYVISHHFETGIVSDGTLTLIAEGSCQATLWWTGTET